MSPADDRPTDDDLHALVDGHLDASRLAAVCAWLGAHPDDARRVAAWQAQRRALRQLHRDTDPGPVPPALVAAVTPRAPAGARRPGAGLAAAAVLLLALGAGGGWGVARLGAAGDEAGAHIVRTPDFVGDARSAHVVFTPEVRHPVEVTAADEKHLVQWLSKRLGAPLRTPDLQPLGFRLLGGRLLPGDGVPRAQFMFEDAPGRRVTLYLSRFGEGDAPAETAFRAAADGPLQTFYWVEGRFGYALAGELPAEELQRIAREVHRQLDGG